MVSPVKLGIAGPSQKCGIETGDAIAGFADVIKPRPNMDDPSGMVLGLHHAQITVPASMEAAAVAFYHDVLGLPMIEKPAALVERGGVWFQLGNAQLHLSIEDGVNRRATKAHLAYEVDNLEAWRVRMIQNEVTPVDTIPIPGYERFEARDPFGNRIEFIQCTL